VFSIISQSLNQLGLTDYFLIYYIELNGNKDILEAKRVTAKTVWEGFSNFTSSHGITQVYSSAGISLPLSCCTTIVVVARVIY